ncbi:MAG: aminotransferase class I/II-fold pyridoxal phosphate-dependent enzyme [Actinobacteria bacterium]|uniref:Unannotated protein n=1 Tax=freshwater metagenome TaxID=449393 RepID=A0A6J5Z5Y2_9ZZZZ|nr:aminotransferase class I/II-fold pyridoxal phosphate-dependent enzyme [Actinomycetota bacterium]
MSLEPLVPRLRPFAPTIFGQMSSLALQVGAINLGQGFPDVDGPDVVKEAALAAIADGRGNQYPPAHGLPELRRAVAAHQNRFYELKVDWEDQVVVGTGASEVIQSAILALVDQGDEVLIFEPWFDIYQVAVSMARGVTVGVPMQSHTLRPDINRLRDSVTSKSKVLLLNSPHNPAGIVFTRAELEEIASIAIEHNLIVISDEAYEHLWYDGHPHCPIAILPGMFERTITVGSAGKSFSFTGWKVGWATGPTDLIAAVRVVRQHLSYVSGGPFQWAIAEGLALPDSYWEDFRMDLQKKRDVLSNGLIELGFEVIKSEGTYFVTTNVQHMGFPDGESFCMEAAHKFKVVAIPHSALCSNPEVGAPFVRWAFCKSTEVLNEALDRLSGISQSHLSTITYRKAD